MKSFVRQIPNLLTCISLAFGFYGAISGLTGNYFCAMLAILIAAVFDFSDGLAARLLKAYSAMGKELDSLADLISFGVAPGMMIFSYLDQLLHTLSWSDSIWYKLLLLSAFALPIFSALRLAKFNIDDRQKTSFIGLPVPAHAIFWASLLAALTSGGHTEYSLIPQINLAERIATIPAAALLICIALAAIATSLLLVSNIPMFSLKMSSFTWNANKLQYILVASSLLLILFFGVVGISLTILLYILLSSLR
jgi:CDP-diacylglycerol--serine O-phosphatidyltransferase